MDIKYAYYESSVGYKITGRVNDEVLLDGGGTKALSNFWTVDNFNPSQYVPTSRTLTINGVTYDLSVNRSWTIPDTITRIKGGTGGTFVSGDITLTAGANVSIDQVSNTITISSVNTTYTAGDGLLLTGNEFSLPVSYTGSGNGVASVTQTADGITVALTDFVVGADLDDYIPISEKGQPNGVATLDSNGLVPTTQLPSYVDDVIEGYYDGTNFYTDAGHTNLITPETGIIYIDLATNKTYRWSGSAYVYITSGAVDSVNGHTGVVVLTKSDIGLSNVDNTADNVKNVLSATKWTTPRTITVTGVSATAQSIDGTGNVSIPITAVPASLLTGTASINTTGSAATLTTPRTIAISGDGTWSVIFDGSSNVSSALTLSNTGVTAGTYDSVTVDAKGRVTAGTNTSNIVTKTITGIDSVTHNFGTRRVDVKMYDTITLYQVYGRIKYTSLNVIDIEFDSVLPNPVEVTVEKMS